MISNFQGFVTLTLDRVKLNTVVHHSSTYTYTPNSIEIGENFLWTDVRTDSWTDIWDRLYWVDSVDPIT